MQNPSPSQLLVFSLLLLDLPARRHKLGRLSLSVLIFARASASCLADLRALAPIGARGFILSRIDYLIPNWLFYPESIIVSRVWGGGGRDREAGGEGDEEGREKREEGMG